MHGRPLLLILGSTLALACSGGPPTEPAPAKADATKPATEAEPAKTELPAKAEPAKAEPTTPKPGDVTTPPVASAAPALRVAATRKSYLEVVASGGRPWLSLEGEAVPLVDGKFTRLPGTQGLMQCFGWQCNVAELAGDPSGPNGVWLVLEEAIERVGEGYEVYHHDGKAWSKKTLREGVLVGYYAPLVERRGTVIGLQQWQPDPNKELDYGGEGDHSAKETAKYEARRDKELRRAKPGFVRVSGPEVVLPKVPEGSLLTELVTTTDGTLWALARPSSGSGPESLLMWAPDAVEAKTVALPDPQHTGRLWASDGTVLVSGCLATVISRDNALEEEVQYCSEAYVAVREGETWQRIPIELPSGAPRSLEMLGLARAPDGALWIAFGDPWYETALPEASPLWHRPAAGGPWAPVPVPTPEAVFGEPATKTGWIARGLVWGADAVWAVLIDDGDRSVVLTSQPGSDPPTELPADDRTKEERTPAPDLFAEP